MMKMNMTTGITTRRILLLAVISAIAFSVVNAGETPHRWIDPGYKTADPTENTLTEVVTYRYRESVLDPAVVFSPVAKETASYETPEHAMIARLSAMTQQNYDWWLETWDAAAQKQIAADNKKNKWDQEHWKAQWTLFKVAKVEIVRRIETEQCTVLTYRLIGKDGGGKNSFELLTVFKKDGNKWLATRDLKNSDLLAGSPWVSGKASVELTVR